MTCCTVKSQCVILFTSFSILVFYMMLGAFMFTAIELPYEHQAHNKSIVQLKRMNETSSNNVRALTYRFEGAACEMLEALKYFKDRDNATAHDQDEAFSWTYTKAIMFSFSTITTLGYGDIVPVTHVGKGVAMLFGLTCIPLYCTMVMLYAKHGLSLAQSLVDRFTADSRKAFLALNGLMMGTLLVAALVFSTVFCLTDGTDFGNSFWYTFATFSTLGFGDHFPNNTNPGLAFYFIVFVTMVYILIGMFVLAWKPSFFRFHRAVERASSTVFGLCCHVSQNDSLRVEVGMSRLEEEPVDVEMEAVQYDTNNQEEEEGDGVFSEKVAS